jgi:hypothetical protein
MTEENTIWDTKATRAMGTLIYQAPELLTGRIPSITTEGDCYSFAITTFVCDKLLVKP